MKSRSSDSIKSQKVLIVSYYWPPSGGAGVQRFLKFAKYLPYYGVEPVILTCSNPTYPILDPSLATDIPNGLAVYYSRTIEPFGLYSRLTGISPQKAANPTTILGAKHISFPQRVVRWFRANLFVPDARIGWVPFARSKARSLVRKYRIATVITTGPPHSTHFIGRGLKRKTGIRWIADFRDPWTDIHYNRALPRTRFTKKWDLRMESSVLKEADHITVTAPGTARYFAQKVNRSYHTIPNGFDPDDFGNETRPHGKSIDGGSSGSKEPPEGASKVLSPTSVKSHRPLLIRHVGSITETSIPVNLIQVLSRFSDDEIRMEFIGLVHPDVPKKVKSMGLENKIKIKSYLPHKKAIALMQQSDINVVVVHRSEDSRILIPGKLYDYLNAGKPVMVIGPPDGDTAAIVRQCRIGQTFDYTDETGLEQWLKTFIHALRTGVSPDSEDYPAFAPDTREISRYSRPALTRQYAALIHGDSNTEQNFSGESRLSDGSESIINKLE